MNTPNTPHQKALNKARKQATNRIYSKWMLPAQITSVLLVSGAIPLGAMMGGKGATAGVYGMAAGMPVVSLLSANKTSRKLKDDQELLLSNLNDEETHVLMEVLKTVDVEVVEDDSEGDSEDSEGDSEDDSEDGLGDSEGGSEHLPDDNLPLHIEHKPITLDPDVPHLTIISGTRQGKSNTIRGLLTGVSNIEYVSSKMNDLVPTHWKGFYVGGSIQERGKRIEWIVNRWEEILSSHASNPDQPSIFLVFDEAVQLTAYAKNSGIPYLLERYEALINEILTQGAAIGVYGAVLAQTKNASTLGLSLDLIRQNSNLICPVKNKRNFSIGIVEKLGGLTLTEDQKQSVLTHPAEYFQLWITQDDRLAYDQLPEYKGGLKELESIDLEGEEISEDSYQGVPQLGMFEDPELTPIQQKIVAHLGKVKTKKTASKIRESCTTSRDNPRLKTAEIQRELDILVDYVLINSEEIDGKIWYYAID